MTTWWEYPTNFSGGQSVNGVADFFFKYPSYILGNTFALGFIVIIWITSFALSLGSGSRKALLTSSFISFIFSIFFVRLDLINPVVPIVLIVLCIIGAIGGNSEGSNY